MYCTMYSTLRAHVHVYTCTLHVFYNIHVRAHVHVYTCTLHVLYNVHVRAHHSFMNNPNCMYNRYMYTHLYELVWCKLMEYVHLI